MSHLLAGGGDAAQQDIDVELLNGGEEFLHVLDACHLLAAEDSLILRRHVALQVGGNVALALHLGHALGLGRRQVGGEADFRLGDDPDARVRSLADQHGNAILVHLVDVAAQLFGEDGA